MTVRHAVLFVLALAAAACLEAMPSSAEQPALMHSAAFDSRDARLSYRLDIPVRRGRVPAVVIGHGSGRTVKEQCRFLAQGFLARGFAVLCYDKRGVGESTGVYTSIGPKNSVEMFDLLAEDMAAAVRLLRTRGEVAADRIGLVGVSQAGWIMPVAAARVKPAFLIALAGPAVSVGEEIFYSDLVEHADGSADEANARLKSFAGAHGFDPRPLLATLNVPGLWLLGSADRSIPIPATVAALDELAAKGRPFTRVVFAGAGHDLSGTPFWAEIDRWLAAQQLLPEAARQR
jgi:pimeloyl-ACP methyl ester carboxylesterase